MKIDALGMCVSVDFWGGDNFVNNVPPVICAASLLKAAGSNMPMYAADFDQRSRSPRWHEHAHQRDVGMRPTSVERAAGAVDKTAVEASHVCWCCGIPLELGLRWLLLLSMVRTGLQCMACTGLHR
ncbi:hypothetical protein [Achromobacter mucicolens]|uniref:hypothetical protein n=1 Tax=Achromobacter mucicolens TaxID=1389922 RepID=UPI002446CA0E|nr:hypothetical protein [Achromobacter mucicolens]MDH1521363.1 hypothetical protein [Achromobacter mucicolens]